MRTWQLQDAKNKLSEVVDEALDSGPQLITRRGEETAVLMSYVEYRRLTGNQQKLSEFFRTSPLAGVDLDLTRDSSPLRDQGFDEVSS